MLGAGLPVSMRGACAVVAPGSSIRAELGRMGWLVVTMHRCAGGSSLAPGVLSNAKQF